MKPLYIITIILTWLLLAQSGKLNAKSYHYFFAALHTVGFIDTTAGSKAKTINAMDKDAGSLKDKLISSVQILKLLTDNIKNGDMSYNNPAALAAFGEAQKCLELCSGKSSTAKIPANDLAKMRKIVSSYDAIKIGKNPESKDVIVALEKNRVNDLKFFLSAKNITDTLINEEFNTLIYALKAKRDVSVVKKLIEIAKAKDEYVNTIKYKYGDTKYYMLPLTYACIKGDTNLVNVLIDAKARFIPDGLPENYVRDLNRFIWEKFRRNKAVVSLLKRRMPQCQDPFAGMDNVKSNILNNMVPIDGGTFTMGCKGSKVDCGRAWPAIELEVAPFSISKYEITQREWEAIMDKNPSGNKNCKDCPVEQVSWDDVQLFIQKLNKFSVETSVSLLK